MKAHHLPLAALVALLATAPTFAQSLAIKVGDTVVPDHEGVELKQGQQVLAALNARDTLTVTHIEGDWIGCQLESSRPRVEKATGWVQRSDVRLPWDRVVREILAAKGVEYLPSDPAGKRQSYDPQEYTWFFSKEPVLRALAGTPEVVELSLRPPIGKDGLAALGQLKRISNLRSLTLFFEDETHLSCLDELSQLPRLENLVLRGSLVTDAALARIRTLSQLRTLRLEGTGVSDAGLVHLQGLRRLQTLEVYCTMGRFTGTGLAYLNGMQCRSLELGATSLTDAGLVNLKTFTQLRELSLRQTQITDAGLVHLRTLTQLRELNLSATQITNAGMQQLAAMPNLTRLWLDNTRVTQGAVMRFRQSHPNCKIGDVDIVRAWTDISGKFKTDATLMDFDDGKVSLAKADGTVKIIPIERLSANDQQYLVHRLKIPRPSGLPRPAVLPPSP